MTDREIVLALLGLVESDTNKLVASLILLKRQVPSNVIVECQEEMATMVKALHKLTESKTKIKDILN